MVIKMRYTPELDAFLTLYNIKELHQENCGDRTYNIKLSNSIGIGFIWSKSPQGIHFCANWKRKFRKYLEVIEEIKLKEDESITT